MDLKAHIRSIPDFPKPGVLFRDITPLLASPAALAAVEERLSRPWIELQPTAVVGIESRGFIFGVLIARRLGVKFVPLRKEGKLPSTRISESYALEYGEAVLEIHDDAVGKDDRVLIVDDLLATGGTAAAAARLVERLGARILGFGFVVELAFLHGREALGTHPVVALVTYDAE
jgi:adenine phosphoribosyltransferase